MTAVKDGEVVVVDFNTVDGDEDSLCMDFIDSRHKSLNANWIFVVGLGLIDPFEVLLSVEIVGEGVVGDLYVLVNDIEEQIWVSSVEVEHNLSAVFAFDVDCIDHGVEPFPVYFFDVL